MGSTVSVKGLSTLYLDKRLYTDIVEKGKTGSDVTPPEGKGAAYIHPGSRLNLLERVPKGFMVKVESAVVSQSSGANSEQYGEDPSLSGRIGWIQEKDIK